MLNDGLRFMLERKKHYSGKPGNVVLNDDILQWLEENVSSYTFYAETYEKPHPFAIAATMDLSNLLAKFAIQRIYVLTFQNEEDAMKFKLSWE